MIVDSCKETEREGQNAAGLRRNFIAIKVRTHANRIAAMNALFGAAFL